jgi:hypothetical protein
MKRNIPLNPAQHAISNLGQFFEPPPTATTEVAQTSQDKAISQPPLDTSIPSKYVKATDLLDSKQKEDLDKHEERIQSGFEKYSAY